ncbi:MAG: hypothetical protein JWN27_2885 [Candidatus Eremiobacteraeota bacterium]|nr:hypothetical protein [Candidatus Eremiobacteraeota bacterium]
MFKRTLAYLLTIVLALSASMASADVPISGLPSATPAGADLTVIVHSGTTSKATVSQWNSVFLDLTTAQVAAGIKAFTAKTIIGAASGIGTVQPISLDVQGVDSFSSGGGGGVGALATYIATSTAAIDKGATIALGGTTGNGTAQYVFGAIRAAKQSAAGDANYGGYLDFYTTGDSGSVSRALRLDKTGLATFSAGVAMNGPVNGATTVTANSGGAGGHLISGAASFYSGTGVPTFSAMNSSVYLRIDGTTGSRWYANTSGASTTGTTWTALAAP